MSTNLTKNQKFFIQQFKIFYKLLDFSKKAQTFEAAEKVAPKALKKIVNWKIIFLIRYFFIQIKEIIKFMDISIHYFAFFPLLI